VLSLTLVAAARSKSGDNAINKVFLCCICCVRRLSCGRLWFVLSSAVLPATGVTLGCQFRCTLPAQEDKANVSCSPRVTFSLTQLPWDAVGGPQQAKHLHKVICCSEDGVLCRVVRPLMFGLPRTITRHHLSFAFTTGAEAAHAGRCDRVRSRSCRGRSESEQARRRVLTRP